MATQSDGEEKGRSRARKGRALTRAEDWRFALGILNANVLAALLMALTRWLVAERNADPNGVYGISATVLIPLLMGMLSALTWRDLPLSDAALFAGALVNTIAGVIVAACFLHEGAVCLVMAFPLVCGLVCAGTFLGAYLFRTKRGGPLSVSVAPVLLALLIGDCLSPKTGRYATVTTAVVVHAPAAAVFPHLVAFPPIAVPATGPLNWLGLPYPVETTAQGAYTGAGRQCRFSGGISVGERITRVVPGHEVDFDVTQQPQYPEIAHHATLLKGRMVVTDNGDGTSTLTGTSWYALRVFPGWYFGPWGDGLIHGVHQRVFDHIRALAESSPAPTPLR